MDVEEFVGYTDNSLLDYEDYRETSYFEKEKSLGQSLPLVKKQRELMEQLKKEQDEKARERLFLAQAKASEGIFVHPQTGKAYKWVGNRLTPISGSGLGGLFQGIINLFRMEKKNEGGVGQAPAVKDPWGMMTTGLPISVRKEVEWEEELERVHREYAPYSRRYLKPGFGDYNMTVCVYRLDNLVTGDPKWPTYAIPYKDKFGLTQIATGKKHPHIAIKQFKLAYKRGRVAKPIASFNQKRFGYDEKMLLYSPTISL